MTGWMVEDYDKSWARGPETERKYFENFSGLTRTIMPYLEGKVLEMGCGIALAGRLCPWYWGVDWSAEALNIAQRDVLHGHFALIDLQKEKLPYSDKWFDTVLLKEIIEHLKDYSNCLAEAKRLAKKTIVITVPIDMPLPNHHHPTWTEEDLEREFGHLGQTMTIFTRAMWWIVVIDV